MKAVEVCKQVAKELNLPEEVVKAAFDSYWEFIRKTISEIPLKTEMTEEEFSKYKTNFNLPSLGKFYCDYNRYRTIRNGLNFVKTKREEINETKES
jgi:hypothetical protein